MPVGFYGKLYYRSGGSYGTPTWTAVNIAEAVQVNPTWDRADAATRESRVKKQLKGLLGLEVSLRMLKVPANTIYIAFMNAMLTDEVLDILVLDEAHTSNNARGYRFDAQVFQANEDQSPGVTMYEDMLLVPSVSANPPKAVLVTGGVPTYYEPGGSAVSFA